MRAALLLVLLVACGSEPGGSKAGALSPEEQRDACEDAAHVLVEDNLYRPGEIFCGVRCEGAGGPAAGCAADESCVPMPRAVDAKDAPTGEDGCYWPDGEPGPSPCAGSLHDVCY